MIVATREHAPVHVILLNYNGWRDTTECLESVLRSEYPALRVVVVDNGSTDGSLDRLESWARGDSDAPDATNAALSHLSSPPVAKPISFARLPPPQFRGDGARLTFIEGTGNIGFARGNNLALRPLAQAGGEGYALVLNNDTVVAPDLVTKLVRRLEQDDRVAAVGGVLLDYRDPDLVQVVGGGRMSHWTGTSVMHGAGARRNAVQAPRRGSLGYLSGACVLLRLDTLRRVGILDERFFLYAEDADWGEEMRQGGYQLDCATDAILWHKGSATSGVGSPFQDYHLVLSALKFVRKRSPFLLPFAASYMVYRCVAPKIVRRQWKRAAAVMLAYVDFARGR